VWTDAEGKLDYDTALEDMVRDARVILAREMRHSILKITGSEEKETLRTTAEAEQAPVTQEPAPGSSEPMNTSEELHERHVIAEHHDA